MLTENILFIVYYKIGRFTAYSRAPDGPRELDVSLWLDHHDHEGLPEHLLASPAGGVEPVGGAGDPQPWVDSLRDAVTGGVATVDHDAVIRQVTAPAQVDVVLSQLGDLSTLKKIAIYLFTGE